jgi:FkbH-like protein
MVRTHQLNTTGYAYSRDELAALLSSPRHLVLMASLEDRYGTYGKVGLALVETAEAAWTIKLLLMSCRVASRGAGALLLNQIRRLARQRGARLLAEFVPNERNRQMYITFRFAGFKEVFGYGGAAALLEDLQEQVPPFPDYVTIVAQG